MPTHPAYVDAEWVFLICVPPVLPENARNFVKNRKPIVINRFR